MVGYCTLSKIGAGYGVIIFFVYRKQSKLSEGRSRNEAVRVGSTTSLVPRPSLMVRLQLVSCSDPLTCEPG